MKPFKVMGRVGVVLLLLNEIRGVLVVISVVSAWSHAGKAAAPAQPASACASTPQPVAVPACRAVRAATSPAP